MSAPPLRLGLDVGGTKCAAVVGTREGEVLDRVQWPSEATRGPGPMIEDLLREGHAAIGRQAAGAVGSVGVSIGGPLDGDAGVIHAPPNLPGWDAVPLRGRLGGGAGVAGRRDARRRGVRAGGGRWGVGRSLPQPVTLAFLTCGTGMGAGLVLRGEAWRGSGGRSPEFGHVRLTEDGPEAFGKRGCVEAWCAGAAFPGLATWLVPERWGPEGAEAAPNGPALSAAAAGGDADARAVLDRHAEMTGRAAAVLGDLLVPDAVVLGSLASRLGDGWLAGVRAAFEAEVLPAVAERCRVVPAALGDRLQDLAALAAAPDA